MNTWPDEALERTMLADADSAIEQYSRGPMSCAVASCACHVRALLARIRELERHEDALTESLVESLAGYRCLAAQYEGTRPYDAAIIAKAHKALKGSP